MGRVGVCSFSAGAVGVASELVQCSATTRSLVFLSRMQGLWCSGIDCCCLHGFCRFFSLFGCVQLRAMGGCFTHDDGGGGGGGLHSDFSFSRSLGGAGNLSRHATRHGTSRQVTVRHGTGRYGTTRHDTVRYCTARHGTTLAGCC